MTSFGKTDSWRRRRTHCCTRLKRRCDHMLIRTRFAKGDTCVYVTPVVFLRSFRRMSPVSRAFPCRVNGYRLDRGVVSGRTRSVTHSSQHTQLCYCYCSCERPLGLWDTRHGSGLLRVEENVGFSTVLDEDWTMTVLMISVAWCVVVFDV